MLGVDEGFLLIGGDSFDFQNNNLRSHRVVLNHVTGFKITLWKRSLKVKRSELLATR